MSYYIHSVPGRLRVKIPQLKNNLPGCQEVQALLLGLEGVQDVEANCLTGSVLVRYDPKFITYEAICNALEAENHFHSSLASDSNHYLNKAAVNAGQTVSKVMLSWVVSQALERSTFGLLAALI